MHATADSIRVREPGWDVRFRATGLIVFAVFGAIWGLAGATYLPGTAAVVVRLVTLLLSLTLAIASLRLLIAARRLPRRDGQEEGTTERRFSLITGINVAGLVVSYGILRALGATLLIAPVWGLIVGLHFLPMVPLLRNRLFAAAGIGLIVFGLIGILGVAGLNVAVSTRTWVAIACVGSAAILWLTGFSGLMIGGQLLSAAHADVQAEGGAFLPHRSAASPMVETRAGRKQEER